MTPCPECRFDASAYTLDDVAATLRTVPDWWTLLTHDRDTTGVAALARRTSELVRALPVDADADQRRALCHDLLHDLHLAGRGLHADGHGVASHGGVVEQINVSGGGVPKTPITSASVGYRGVDGDRQRTRRHHGRVWQALCLFPSEAIDRLRADGHPIAAGSVGENLTVRGIDWPALRPNTVVRIGTVVAELTMPAIPCKHNARWFTDGDFSRLEHSQHPADTRWYAAVLVDGEIRPGDAVVVEP